MSFALYFVLMKMMAPTAAEAASSKIGRAAGQLANRLPALDVFERQDGAGTSS
jgi:hypothetical protein